MKARRICVLPLLAAMSAAGAAEPRSDDAARSAEPSRFALRTTQLERATERSGRFALRARLAPAESAGELREGGDLVLIGRLSKAAMACGTGTVFRNGFEGN